MTGRGEAAGDAVPEPRVGRQAVDEQEGVPVPAVALELPDGKPRPPGADGHESLVRSRPLRAVVPVLVTLARLGRAADSRAGWTGGVDETLRSQDGGAETGMDEGRRGTCTEFSRPFDRVVRVTSEQRSTVRVMSFTLWLSAEEERILAKIMKAEGARSKEQAVIKAIRDKGDLLAADRPIRETPETTERAPGA